MKAVPSLKIGISGVRGIVGDSLTPQLAAAFAQAFGTYVGPGVVIVGQDSRKSGMMLSQAVLAGLLATGCQPLEIGICPIPSVQVLTKEAGSSGAICVTASHNPKEWNGLKFISGEGRFLNSHQMDEFLDIYHQGEFSLVDGEKYKSPRHEANPAEPHFRKLLAYFDRDLIRGKKFRVAVDCCNGAGAMLSPQFLESLGCEPVLMNCVPDGSFAHHPEPLPENIAELCAAVRKNKADIGFVQDADADRLAIVNENGEPLGEELTLLLATRYVLGRKPGAVVTNLSASRAIDDIAAAYGVPVFRTKTGEINVVEQILALGEKAAIGGEGNGGVILPAIHPCRDSFTAMGLALEAMARSGKAISTLQREIPKYHMVKERIEGTQEQAFRLIRELRKRYEGKGEISLLDGMKIQFEQGWVHIRPSNTEPIIRLIAEAKTAARAEKLVEEFKEEIREIVR
jgi:phosphomannomutase